ncbi:MULTISPECIES: hypothetical protein [Herbaspirillum]|jgi:hypothetical protein|uniref:Uncharacterized protein n=1 Tax=Herbaspirillum aquaticum TaxID=568783 RepID=A0A225SM13_9BURK|nr:MULTISPECIES: hypothetical protein [Herbaspirillum]MBW9336643.1 hypothetical protein [Herbaspirillum sp. RU 5E]MRT27705.1 hypothetical protein [Herbaspirillum sp. CAH-3]OWY32120.1 hypothetical protein CEJ45_22570 [Herbaspirillum aquaticum]
MSFGKTLLWAAGIAGVAVGASLRMLARQAQRRDQRQQDIALQRWEDEGGSARSVAQRRVR